jgi:hypothetical protein
MSTPNLNFLVTLDVLLAEGSVARTRRGSDRSDSHSIRKSPTDLAIFGL